MEISVASLGAAVVLALAYAGGAWLGEEGAAGVWTRRRWVSAAAGVSVAPAQNSTARDRERVTASVAVNLALEGSGPWFAPGARLVVPLGHRYAVDVESSAVFGGRLDAPYGSITSFLAMNLRRLTGSRPEDGTARYWIYGLRYTPIARVAPRPGQYEDDVALTIGHGWDQVFGRPRVAAEVGVSGGRGFLLFATLVVGIALK